MAAINTPILLIHGDEDPIIPFAASDYISKKLPACTQYEIIASAGHSPLVTQTEKLVNPILKFQETL